MNTIIDEFSGIDINQKKSEAKEQFDRMTRELDIKHTFSFDEVWDMLLKNRYRTNVVKFEDEMKKLPNVLVGKETEKLNPLEHSFADGCYIRKIFNPKGEVIVTKIHKLTHPYFLMSGDMSILTENGPVRIKAPYNGITKAGTKRIIYTHEDCVFITVHVTDKTDIDEIEKDVIAEDFESLNEEDGYVEIPFEKEE